MVLESDGETEVAVPVNTLYTVDCCHRYLQRNNDCNTKQSIVSFLKDKQDYEDNELRYSMIVSGASSLSDQVRRVIIDQCIQIFGRVFIYR